MKGSHALKDSTVHWVKKCLQRKRFNWDNNIMIGRKCNILIMDILENFISKKNLEEQKKTGREGRMTMEYKLSISKWKSIKCAHKIKSHTN